MKLAFVRLLFLSIVLSAGVPEAPAATTAWPGESFNAAADLTSLDPVLWVKNLSGAYWNPVTRRLWLADNSGTYSVLKEDGAGGFAKVQDFAPGGDLEGITQADPGADRVYLMAERVNIIREFVASTGVLNQSWDLTPLVGGMADPNDGTEGIAFIPNAWLAASGFRDLNGNLYTQSAYGADGLGGIMLVAVQDAHRATAGYVYAVDLKNDGTWTTVGRFKTNHNDSSDLAFDASIGRLYILHNVDGNILEITDLTSAPFGTDRKFTTINEFQIPSSSNIEGFAITPALKSDHTLGDRWCFLTDDANQNGALRWFKQLPSPISINAGNAQSAFASSPVAVPPSVVVRDAFQNPLSNFAVTFAVTAGSGTITGAATTTNAQGVATVGSWTLGPSSGANTLSVTGAGLSGSPLAITATGIVNPIPKVLSIDRLTPAAPATNAFNLSWRVTFNQPVKNVGPEDFTLTAVEGTFIGPSVTSVSESAGTTIDVTAYTGGGDGVLRLDVYGGEVTIVNSQGTPITGDFTSGMTYTIDRTPPDIRIGAPSALLTRHDPVTCALTYTGADVVTLTANDVTLIQTGTASGSISVSGSGAARLVTIANITGTGTLAISLLGNTAADNAGNTASTAGPSAAFIVDNTPPTLAISAPSAVQTRAGPLTFTLTYTGADTITLHAADVTLVTSGTAAGSVGVSGSGSTRTVSITGITGDGTLAISIAPNTASDLAGNQAAAAGTSAAFDTRAFNIIPVIPEILWPPPARIFAGIPLSAVQLNALAQDPLTHATVAGTYLYTPAPNTVLAPGVGQTLSVIFTPDDAINYAPATASTPIDVDAAIPAEIVSPLTASGEKDVAFSYTIAATGSAPLTFTANGLPPGLALTGGTIAGTPSATGVFYTTLSAINAGGTDAQTLTITILQNGPNHPPIFTSAPSASANPATTGAPVTFTAHATDADGDALGYEWDFGDGTLGTGAAVTKTYSAAGVYVVTLSVSDGQALESQRVNLVVEDQLIAGTLEIQAIALAFNFAKTDSDRLTLSGEIPLPAAFNPAGKSVRVLIGGCDRTYVLNAKGASADKAFVLKGKFTAASARFSFALKNQTLFAEFQTLGFSTSARADHVPLPIIIVLDGRATITQAAVSYTVITNKNGPVSGTARKLNTRR